MYNTNINSVQEHSIGHEVSRGLLVLYTTIISVIFNNSGYRRVDRNKVVIRVI